MSEFTGFCSHSKAVINKVAATVPVYEFTGSKAGPILGADLDGNGKVDLVSYYDKGSLSNYEKIRNSGDLKNGLWKKVGTITREELIALRKECGDEKAPKGLLGGGIGAGLSGSAAILIGYEMALFPFAAIGLAIALAGIFAVGYVMRMDETVGHKVNGLLQYSAKGSVGGPL